MNLPTINANIKNVTIENDEVLFEIYVYTD